MTFAWVIEKGDSEQSRPRYFTGQFHPSLTWSRPGDHDSAVRFSRQQDAAPFAEYLTAIAGCHTDQNAHRVNQHGWGEEKMLAIRSIVRKHLSELVGESFERDLYNSVDVNWRSFFEDMRVLIASGMNQRRAFEELPTGKYMRTGNFAEGSD